MWFCEFFPIIVNSTNGKYLLFVSDFCQFVYLVCFIAELLVAISFHFFHHFSHMRSICVYSFICMHVHDFLLFQFNFSNYFLFLSLLLFSLYIHLFIIKGGKFAALQFFCCALKLALFISIFLDPFSHFNRIKKKT